MKFTQYLLRNVPFLMTLTLARNTYCVETQREVKKKKKYKRHQNSAFFQSLSPFFSLTSDVEFLRSVSKYKNRHEKIRLRACVDVLIKLLIKFHLGSFSS